MIKNIYAVYDSKAQAYMEPWFTINHAMALRAFSLACNDAKHPFGETPQDYSLFHIGTWNDEIGRLNPEEQKLCMANGLELLKPKTQPDLFEKNDKEESPDQETQIVPELSEFDPSD